MAVSGNEPQIRVDRAGRGTPRSIVQRQVEKLHQLVGVKAATDGEKTAANRQLIRLMSERVEGRPFSAWEED